MCGLYHTFFASGGSCYLNSGGSANIQKKQQKQTNMKPSEIKKHLAGGKPLPPEVFEAGATVLVEVIKQLFNGRGLLRKRVEQIETVCKLQAEQIAKLEKQVNGG